MTAGPNISIVIVTRNRCDDLAATLRSFAAVAVPRGDAELLVVDNGSTDGTAAVAEAARSHLPQFDVRVLRQPAIGKSRGLNLAVREARGDILVFTDDDVRPRPDWLVQITEPIVAGDADAAQGTILLAEALRKPWMGHRVRASLAHHEPRAGQRVWLIGANCAVSKRVFDRIAGFDVRIGPPFTSGGEDTLLSDQLEAAGFRVVAAPRAVVEHHPQSVRLERQRILWAAWAGGRTQAYLAHHWHKQRFEGVPHRLVRAVARLAWHRLVRWRQWGRAGVADWEHEDMEEVSRWWHYLKIRCEAPLYKSANGEGPGSAVPVRPSERVCR